MENFISKHISNWGPAFLVLLGGIALILLLRYFLFVKKIASRTENQLGRQLLMLVLTATIIVLFILTLPISESLRGQFLSLLGILFTAAIALSSTTFLGNAMAGLMLRAVENFRPGDFLRAGDHFGRVSERALLHTEIQTEDRDLTTLPNLYLVTNPVTVVRSSGTIVSATVSLGYDVSHNQITGLLIEAAEVAELKESFVQILELGDFSITYRVAGFLTEVKTLISARSRLRACMLDVLHKNNIEIVSPSFMNQRHLENNQKIIPNSVLHSRKKEKNNTPEEIIFDKAEEAESKELLLDRVHLLTDQKKKLEALLQRTKNKAKKENLKQQLYKLEEQIKLISSQIANIENSEN